MSYVVRFSDELAKILDDQVALALDVWSEAKPTLLGLRITAGNYAGYGAYLARCHHNGLIEIPVGNAFSLVAFDADNQIVPSSTDHRALLGTLLHEIGHHVVNTADREPWTGIVQVGQSTHQTAAWVWICCTGWNRIGGTSIDPNDFARRAKTDEGLREQLSSFNPYFPPVFAKSVAVCNHCGLNYEPKRTDSRFCSTKCRVASHRSCNARTRLSD